MQFTGNTVLECPVAVRRAHCSVPIVDEQAMVARGDLAFCCRNCAAAMRARPPAEGGRRAAPRRRWPTGRRGLAPWRPAASSQPTDERYGMRGTVDRLVPAEGFGFIIADNGQELFFHRTA